MVGNHGGRRLAIRMRATTMIVALAGIALVALPSVATAGTIALDAPDNGAAPLVAFDPVSQVTFVTWEDPITDMPDLCVLPAGAGGCEGGAPLQLNDAHYNAGNFSGPGGLVVLPDGNVVLIGTPTSTASVAWESPADGSGFFAAGNGLQNGGNTISPVSLFYAFDNAVALSNSDVALLDDYGDYFSDSPFAATSPAINASNSNQTTPPGEFSRKSLWSAGPEIAAETAPPPAPAGTDIVVGVGDNFSGPSLGLPGCLNSSGTGFGVSAGVVNGASAGAGTLNSKGLPAYGVLTCSAEAPVLAQGGQDGIGELEQDGNGNDGAGSTYTINYRAFVATATGGSFGPSLQLADVTSQVLAGVNSTDLAEDSGTGVYAAWTDEQGLVLDYSADGGASWGGPVVVPGPPAGFGDPVIDGVGGGTAQIAFKSNPGTGTQVFLEQVNYQALVAAEATPVATATTVTTSQTAGTTTGAEIAVPAGTVGETDRATIAGTNAGSAGGTVAYALYSSSTCSAASQLANSTAAVVGGVAGPSSAVTVALSPGNYYWRATYSGDAKNAASQSECGSEVLIVNPASTIGGSGASTSTTVTLTITCAQTPCTVTVTITVPVTTTATRRLTASKRKTVTKILTLASGTFKIKKKGPNVLVVNLSKKGKSYLASKHGRLTASVLVTEKIGGHTFLTTHTLKITPAKPKRR